MSFVVYRASAGSGKTYTLVNEYLKVVLDRPEAFREVLAITFTKKSAYEMKDRVIKALKALALGHDPALEETLRQEEHLKERNIQEDARGVLDLLLHDYSSFAIMTIDSFIHKIVKGVALELDLPMRFRVDMNEDVILEKIIDALLEDVGQNYEVTELLYSFMYQQIDLEKSWNPEQEILETAQELFKEEGRAYLRILLQQDPEMIHHMISGIKEQITQYRKGIHRMAQDILTIIAASELTVDDFPHQKSGIVGKVITLSTGQTPDDFQLGPRFIEGKWTTKKTPEETKKLIDFMVEGKLEALRQRIIIHTERYYKEFKSLFHLQKSIHSLTLIKTIEAYLDRYKRANQIIPISEFNQIVSDIISGGDSVSFLFEQIGERYQYYLIDEFQDTSKLQWQNLFPMILEALAQNGSCMAVGDAKQAIYRWRGGDVDIMQRRLFEEISPVFTLTNKVLETNFRSRERVVTFNNLFFREAPKVLEGYCVHPTTVREIYKDVQQTLPDDQQKGGCVTITQIELESEKNRQEFYYQDALKELMDQVDELQNEGYSNRDIAILVRTKREGNMVVRALYELNIPVISSESLLIYREPVIAFLISLFRYLIQPESKLVQGKLVRCYQDILKDPRDFSPLDHDDGITRVLPRQFFKELPRLKKISLYRLAERLIDIFKLDKRAHFSGYLQSFLDAVFRYQRREHGDLADFLLWWGENREKIILSSSDLEDAVQVMTIHKSKGLQFPVVLIPFASWSLELKTGATLWLKPDQPVIGIEWPLLVYAHKKKLENTVFYTDFRREVERNMIDNLNLLYVAFTRAKQQLHIITRKVDGKGLKTISDLIQQMIAEGKLGFRFSEIRAGKLCYGTQKRIEEVEPQGDIGTMFLKELLVYRGGDRVMLPHQPEIIPGDRYDLIMPLLLQQLKHLDQLEEGLSDLERHGLFDSQQRYKIKNIFLKKILKSAFGLWLTGVRIKPRSCSIDGVAYQPDGIFEYQDRLIVYRYQEAGKERCTIPKQYIKKMTDYYQMPTEGYLISFALGGDISLEQI